MSSSHRSFKPLSFEEIKAKKERGEFLIAPILTKALIEEAKIKRNFSKAEILYQYLRESLPPEPSMERHKGDIRSFQRGITTMVRYSPNPEKALYYANHFFTQLEYPLRNAFNEVVILTNLLYVYTSQGIAEEMKTALKIIRLALDIGVFRIDPENYINLCSSRDSFDNPLQVFETVCKKPLQYHGLEFNADKSDLVQAKSYRY
ncbi:uncharacterized protein B0P05DRAFT_553627 [Gilbertella persicaria]|uniref:uncharacterized protein n=1 Tax=Gilbertella persicaria TaxID=101096 RepID=UPI0022206CC2|nr:uncharacterized protein B0P05DRAFT_553627 [Gilbertella persicaria]KAI8066266.1 hypothetical protein B0P05DRAFT_553627 [Gilbertella persicaria]